MSRFLHGKDTLSSMVESARPHRFRSSAALVVFALGALVFSASAALKESTPEFVRRAMEQLRLTQSSAPGSDNLTAAGTPTKLLKTTLVAGLNRFLGQTRIASPAIPGPVITATKTDFLLTDVDGDTKADPGDTLKYTVVISNSGSDATGVSFNDTVDANTTLDAGSIATTPLARNDSYSASGNIRITVAAPGVLANDSDPDGVGPALTVTAGTFLSTQGGNVNLSADGSFTFNPPAGFEGSDSFTYTLDDGEGNTDTGTVTITVSGMIWFVNNAASCPCDGRLTNPFNTLAAFQAVNNGTGNNPAAGDNVFLYESGVDYVGPVTLLNNQKLIGQDATASLSAISGVTPPAGSDPLPAMNSGNGTIVNVTSAGNSINVASGNTLRGFTGGNSAADVTGTGFGTLTISDVTLNGTGQALSLTTGTLAATFGGISSTDSATTGISLTGVAGSLTTPTTTIANPTGIGLSVGTSSATLGFGTTSSTASGGTGVSLTTNTGAITFGSLTITPDANQRGLLATENSQTITATSGAVTTTGATAVEISKTTGATPLAVSMTSVSANGGANGILLSNTSGSFTVAGSGGTCTSATPTCTGGRIQSTAGADGTTAGRGVSLNNATNVSLTRMHIDNHPNFAIKGDNVTGFTLDTSVIDGTNGTSAAQDEGDVGFDNLLGSASISNSVIGGTAFENLLDVVNTSGTLDRLTVDGTTFGSVSLASGQDAFRFEARNSSVMNLTVTSSTFTNGRNFLVNVAAQENSDMDVVFRGNVLTNNHAGILSGGGGSAFGSVSSLNVTYDISCNSFRGAAGAALIVFKGVPGAGGMTGSVVNNRIGATGVANSGSSQASGIFVASNGMAGTHTIRIADNIIRQYNEAGIFLRANDSQNPSHSTLNATVTGNTTTEPGAFAFAGLYAESGAFGLADTNVINLLAGGAGGQPPQNDFLNGDPGDFNDVSLNAATVSPASAVLNLSRASSISNDPIVVIQDNNVGSPTVFTDSVTLVNTSPALPPAVTACVAPASAIGVPASEDDAAPEPGGVPDVESEDVLRAVRGERADGDGVPRLSREELMVTAQAAIERWRAAGLSEENQARLEAATFEIVDLPDGRLATATSTHVRIDPEAAGYGWFIGRNFADDSDFGVPVPGREIQTIETSEAHGRIDLLTVVLRELGHVIGEKNLQAEGPQAWLMQKTLGTGVRRAPSFDAPETGQAPTPSDGLFDRAPVVRAGTGGQGRGAASPSGVATDVSLTIGTLPAGKSITITFNVTINSSFLGTSVSNQGTVTADGPLTVLTDDPDTVAANDPTVTPVDQPDVTVAVAPASVAEDGATNLVYTFTREGPTTSVLTVNFSVGGTALFTQPDYTQTDAATFTDTSGTVTFTSGNSTATVTLDPSADSTVEPDETAILTVTSGTGYEPGTPAQATGTITNDDTDVSVAVSPAAVAEDGATNLVYTFTRAGVTTGALTVNFDIDVGGNNATFSVDYTQTGAAFFVPPAGTVSFADGSATATVTVDPTADTLVEPDETVVLTVASGTGYNVGSPDTATGTITNDDADVSVAVSPASVAEDGPTNLVYTFTRTGVNAAPLTVNFSVGGTALFTGSDYTQTGAATFTDTSGTVTFAALSSTATVTVDPTTDGASEPDETVVLTVTSGTGYNVGSPDSATGTITNDDNAVSVVVSPASVAEDGATNLVYTFTRTDSSGTLTVNFSVGGTASFAEPDYTPTGAATFSATSGTVDFAAGNATATVTVDPTLDSSVEPDETVILTVTSGAGYGVGAPSAATGTITNDDTSVSVAVSPASVDENGITNLVYTFTRNGATAGPLTANFSVGGTASFPGDYTQTGAASFSATSGTVGFADSVATATVTVDPTLDATVETDETVILTVLVGTGYGIGSPDAATGTITNDDTDVTVAVSPASVAEDGATNLVYTFSRTGVTSGALTVDFTVGGSATFGGAGADYTQSGAATFSSSSGTATFGAGNSTTVVTVDPTTDVNSEGDETVILTLTSGTGYNAASPSTATGTILDDDGTDIEVVSKTRAPAGLINAGANVTYTITVRNNGPLAASTVTVTDNLPSQVTFVSCSASGSGVCGGSGNNRTVTYASLASGATETVTLVATVNCNVANGTSVSNTASASAASPPDNVPGNNSQSVSFTVNNPAPVVVTTVTSSSLPQNSHELLNVGLAATVNDGACTAPAATVQVFGDEDDQTPTGGNEVFSPDARDIALSTLRLRAERVSTADGRVYLVVVKATDSGGGTGFGVATVTVSKSGNKKDAMSVTLQANSARTFANANNGAPPAAYFVIGDGPVIGAKQ